MALKIQAGYEDGKPAVFLERKRYRGDFGDNIELTVAEAEKLLKALPKVIAEIKAMKPQKWAGE